MRKYAFFCVVFVILAFQMGPLTDAQADVVGRLTQVEGRVDILRGGKLPAIPVKADDAVQPGDVLRTKSLSKAQITFIDNSTMAISPESRVAIESYMYDAAKNKRNAVIELFKGLAHVVVSKVYQSAEPDFVVKTQTAIMGIRGTDFGIRLGPNSSDILNFSGLLQVGNIFPEVGQLPQRVFKVAYSFGSIGGAGHWVFLKANQATTVAQGLPPTGAYTISDEDRRHFMNQLGTGLNICRRNPEAGDTETGGGPPSETISGCATTTGDQGDTGGLRGFSVNFLMSPYAQAYTPPTVTLTGETSPSNPDDGDTTTPPDDGGKPTCDHRRHHHFGWHHHFHFSRDFSCRRDYGGWFGFGFPRNFWGPRGYDNRFGFGFTRNFFNTGGRGDPFNFGFGFTRNFFNPGGHGGQFQSFCVATLRTQHNLNNFTRTGPLSGHFFAITPGFPYNRGGFTPPLPGHYRGPGPGMPHFLLTNLISKPMMHFSPNFPGNACHLPTGPGGHQGAVVHQPKHKPLGNLHQPPCGQVNRGPLGPNPPGGPGNSPGSMTSNFGHQPRG